MRMEPEQSHRLTAAEARNKYGIRAAVLLALAIWFGYDGWFNPNIQAKTFNKIGSILLVAGFLFCAVMAGSAALTVLQQGNPPPPPPEPPSTPPSA